MINEVWKQHNPLFQQKVTDLTKEGMSKEDARNSARERMLDRDINLFLDNYKDILKLSALLMGSTMHRNIRQKILRLTNLEDVPLEQAISRTLNEHKTDFGHLFVEN